MGADARRGRRPVRRSFGSRALANGVPLLFLALWWWFSTRTSPLVIPSPGDVAGRTLDLLVGDASSHTYTSFARIGISVVLSMLIGGAVVIVANVWEVTERLIGYRVMPFVNSIPALGWAILGVIWFGVGDFAVIFVLTAILLPFSMVNLWEGMRAMDRDLQEMGRSFTRSRRRVMRLVEIPLLGPYALAAVRLSFAVGWKVALIAEFFGADSGLGLVMNRARQNFDTPTVFATIVVVVIFVIAVDRLVFDTLGKRLAVRSGTGVAVA